MAESEYDYFGVSSTSPSKPTGDRDQESSPAPPVRMPSLALCEMEHCLRSVEPGSMLCRECREHKIRLEMNALNRQE